MPHAAAQAASILAAAAALGLKVAGHRTRCVHAHAHEGGDDTRPSLTFFPQSNRFKCFSCGAGGDVIDLVMAVRGGGFREAAAWVENLNGSPPSTSSSSRPAVPRARTPDEEATEVYAELFQNTYAIASHMPAGKYLGGRGLDLDLVNEHHATQIGDPREVWSHLRERFSLERLRAAGLTTRSGGLLFARHRLLFFYFDGGWPVFVQARDMTGEARCKELSLGAGLHSPVPYNVDLLRRPQECIYVCEGCIDTLSALQLGMPAVGVPGVTAFRPEWFDCFREVDRVVLLFDDDEAGRRQAAELRAQFRLRGVKADAYRPAGVKDVNDLLKKTEGCR